MKERAITEDDIAAAQRALRMRAMNDAQLQFVQRAHQTSPRFASRVIVAAAEFLLTERNGGKP